MAAENQVEGSAGQTIADVLELKFHMLSKLGTETERIRLLIKRSRAPLLGQVFQAAGRIATRSCPLKHRLIGVGGENRYDVMSFLGHPWVETPAMDAMARDGVYFKNAMVTTSLCSPSRASILTGQYMHNHGVVDNNVLP